MSPFFHFGVGSGNSMQWALSIIIVSSRSFLDSFSSELCCENCCLQNFL